MIPFVLLTISLDIILQSLSLRSYWPCRHCRLSSNHGVSSANVRIVLSNVNESNHEEEEEEEKKKTEDEKSCL